MTALTEGRHAAEFIVSEANGSRSRETVTIANSAALAAGTILGKVTASGKYKQRKKGATSGEETAVAVLYAAADASSGDVEAVAIVRDAEVDGGALTYDSGSTAATVDGQLADVGIIVR